MPKQQARPVLRHFLYLDENLIRDFLGQMPGGLERETERHVERTGRRGVGGGANLEPVGINANVGDETKRLSDVTVEHTAAGEFQRLHSLLGEDGIEQLLALDDRIWSALQVFEILEFGAIVSLPAIARLVDVTEKFAPVAQMLSNLGKLPGSESTDWHLVASMMNLFRTEHPSFLAAVAGAPKFRFVCKLDPKWMKVTLDEMQGEATVFGKLQRKIVKGQKLPTIDLMTDLLKMQDLGGNRAERRRRERTAGATPKQAGEKFPDEYELQIGYPAAVLTPIAVFR